MVKMYQYENGNNMFDSFIYIFEKILEKHTPIQTVVKGGVNFKKSKPWLTQELKHSNAQKHFSFNKRKQSPDRETYKEIKRVRNLVIKRLRENHNNFCINFLQNLPSKEQWKFIKQKISRSEQSVEVDEIRLDIGETSRHPKKSCLNLLI